MATILLAMASAVFGFWVGAHRDRRAEEVALAGALLDELTTFQERFATYYRLVRGQASSGTTEPIRLELGLAADRIRWRSVALGLGGFGDYLVQLSYTAHNHWPYEEPTEKFQNELYVLVSDLQWHATRVVSVTPLRRRWDRLLRRPVEPFITRVMEPDLIDDTDS